MPLDKRSCMTRAKALLVNPTPEDLRYAALELRLCIEALTYEKLRSFSAMIPESVLETWQPPQAVRALLEFEPEADGSFTIYAGVEEEYGKSAPHMQFVGRHNSLGLKWLRKHYNKLGNFLHAPSPIANASPDVRKLKEYLAEVVSDLEAPLNSTILGGSIREVFSFICGKCTNPVVCNARTVASLHKATCFNPQCSAEYHVTISSEGQATFQLMVTAFECANTDCAGIMPVENRKLDIGVDIQCPICRLKHVIVNRQWLYVPKESSKG